MIELDKTYNPKETEEKIYQLWEQSGFFNPDKLPKVPNLKSKNYAILLPPPNITGSLHLGHALNAVISDILIRYHRMKGDKTVWFPGVDHAGIATQNVVEKNLKKQGISRWDLGREKFIDKIWEWKNKYGDLIIKQLKKLGVSCDWSRQRFTMDANYAEAVKKAFFHYYKKGLIYRGKRVVNWCPRCQTSLSDLEIEYKEEKTKLYYIKYSGDIIVATTRPETMLGDAAVAINPQDSRYKKLIGKKILLPIQNREVPIISDRAVDMNFGTGVVKVTPAHDLLDAEIAERHNLPFYQIINEQGRMTEAAGKDFEGLKVLEAREKVIEELKKLNLIEKIEDYQHNLAVCYRCEKILEPLLSDQWFLKIDKLAKMAFQAVHSGKIKFIPKKFEKIYFDWLNPPQGKIKDWCISRQIWWGHPLPEELRDKNEKSKIEVLDTWFSSALWPFAGLSKKDLKEFYPSNILITARDIINLWVARMIFSGLEFKKKIPFSEVLIHATILTKEGRRMSKSLGTGIDPLELIEKYGADATRFGIIWQIMGNQDIHWDESAVIAGKKFANKLWNISRFVLRQSIPPAGGQKSICQLADKKEDKEILGKLEKIKKQIKKNIKDYKFGPALHSLYNFIWHDFADEYIEIVKKRENQKAKKASFLILLDCLKMLHPFMPFITERIYQQLPLENKSFLMVRSWP